jgi:hypothetical protein
MSSRRYFRDLCRSGHLRKARLLRAQRALDLREKCYANFTAWPADSFSSLTKVRLFALRQGFEMLAAECANAANANLRNQRAACHRLERQLQNLQSERAEIMRRDAQWSETAEKLRHELRQLLQEGKQYESSVQDRLQYYERSFGRHLERASRLLAPDIDCAKAAAMLAEARKELEIPRSAVQRTRSLSQKAKDVQDMGLHIDPVRSDSLQLAELVRSASDHCRAGDYVQADNEAKAAEQLTESIRNRISDLVANARIAQRQWQKQAVDYPEFGRLFAARIVRVLVMTDPHLMLPEWDRLHTQIAAFALQSACVMGNGEQQVLAAEIGTDSRVNWSAHLDRDELLRFARACVRSEEVVSGDADLAS